MLNYHIIYHQKVSILLSIVVLKSLGRLGDTKSNFSEIQKFIVDNLNCKHYLIIY